MGGHFFDKNREIKKERYIGGSTPKVSVTYFVTDPLVRGYFLLKYLQGKFPPEVHIIRHGREVTISVYLIKKPAAGGFFFLSYVVFTV